MIFRLVYFIIIPMKYKITRQDEIRFNCPFCQTFGKTPDTKYHLYVSLSKGLFHCFRCESSGHVDKLPQEYKNVINALRSELQVSEVRPVYSEPTLPPDLFTELPRDRVGDYMIVDKYLAKRLNVRPEELHHYISPDIYSAVLDSSNELWVMIKSMDWMYQQDYFILRKLSSKKYYNPPNTEKPLFKINFMNIVRGGRLFIVEGVFDALAITKAFDEVAAVALLGKSLSSAQMEELISFADLINEIYVCLDGDAKVEAIKLAQKIYQTFPTDPEKSVSVNVILLKESEDPSSVYGDILQAAETSFRINDFNFDLDPHILLAG